MQKVKIIFFINSMTKGGAERVIANLSNNLVNKNYEVGILTLNKQKIEYEIESKVNIYSLETNLTPKKNIKSKIANLKKLDNFLKQNKPDIVISFLPRASYYSALLCKKNNIKLIISERNDPKSKYKNIKKIITKYLYGKADGLVFQTKEAQEFFTKKAIKKSVIIENPISREFLDTKISTKRNNNIVAVGRLTEQKNHMLLLKSFKTFLENNKKYKLIIYGEGKLRNDLEKYIKENDIEKYVKLPGLSENIINDIKDSSLFILSSDYEGMPNALMEAMALGLPCISTDCRCGGPKALIKNNKTGILIEPNNQKQLSNAMALLLNDKNLALKMSQEAKKQMQEYSIELINSKWEKYINNVVKRSKNND